MRLIPERHGAPRSRALLTGTALMGALLGLVPVTPVSAATLCPVSALNWDATARTLHMGGPVSCSLTDLTALRTAPVRLVDPARKVWLLSASLVIERGATLLLHGTSAGGNVDELRIRSNNGASPTFGSITADWGTIDIRQTSIRSWDESAGVPDTEYTNGRAFIRVASSLDAGGTARQSRMDITDSDVSYLGYPAPESYGLNWKVRGTTPGIYDAVGVFGDVTNSHVHHNYFGFFTFGAEAMRFAGNEVDHNVVYGIDPHDDSDRLVIENNFVHHNGTHGIICSKRCDHLVIRNNRSVNNGGNGIMLHSQVTDSLVENNTATGNGDAGIALFESHRNTVRSNKLSKNAYGIRLSVGSANNRVEKNTVSSNSKYGVYLYQGTDIPVGGVGRPHHNQFVSNTIAKSGSFAVRIINADDNTFKKNRYSGKNGGVSVEGGLRNTLDL